MYPLHSTPACSAEIEKRDLLALIVMDLARVRRMLGMALIIVVTFLLLSFLVVRNSSPQDTNNYYKAFARNKGVKIETHNIITQKVLYS